MFWLALTAAAAALYFLTRDSTAAPNAVSTEPESTGPDAGPDAAQAEKNQLVMEQQKLFDESFPELGLPTWGELGAPGSPFTLPSLGDLGDWAPGNIGSTLGLSEAQKTPRSLPANAKIDKRGDGAEAPMQPGERVVFHVSAPGVDYGAVEGIYAGPTDPSHEDSYVYVDRVADAAYEAPNLEHGRYRVPVSKYKGYNDHLLRVRWYVVSPSAHGMAGFATPPSLAVGDRVTVLARDGEFTTVVAIARIMKMTGDLLMLRLESVHKVVVNEGVGPVVLPALPAQATVSTSIGNLVDPKSIPK